MREKERGRRVREGESEKERGRKVREREGRERKKEVGGLEG